MHRRKASREKLQEEYAELSKVHSTVSLKWELCVSCENEVFLERIWSCKGTTLTHKTTILCRDCAPTITDAFEKFDNHYKRVHKEKYGF